ncbi:polysaccharide lyase family 1 protein [Collybia nuda]|uniref:Polysaccharide lyase family 1 protein n=1 Tax=Collybia nuda TaxID=64659 RepID=A0A9P5YDE6_9AGAR|nr:polysaccharide lyase family 1 protein [Collybia nuda]
MKFPLALITGILFRAAVPASALLLYLGRPPSNLPLRTPFGFASTSTGGVGFNSSTYVVTNATDLRVALKLPFPKVVYVNGTIYGNQLDDGSFADCQWYIDTSPVPNYNFTLYVLSLNTTYMSLVADAMAANVTFEGKNATELNILLRKQNGWRAQAQNSQKKWEGIDMTSNTTLVGWDADARLAGVRLGMNLVNNIHVRNLILEPPQDCFPAPETYPATWNARYDAIAAVTSTNVWIDGNTFQDGLKPVAPDYFLGGWWVDRYDGLFDAEDGCDNITFSHNIVRNHHKSLLWGGGNKEADRDLGKMHFTVFGNRFKLSQSRNPLMRFGTFHIQNNLFDSTNNLPSSDRVTVAFAPIPPIDSFQYHFGIYNQSKVLVSQNVFKQDGLYPNDDSLIFTFKDLTRADIPAKLCAENEGNTMSTSNIFNGMDIDLGGVAKKIFSTSVSQGLGVEGGLVFDCEGDEFSKLEMPRRFPSTHAVEGYVLREAGSQ